MIQASDFEFSTVQTVVWTTNNPAFSQAKFLAAILGRFSEKYNGAVQTIPLPDSASQDIPRVILESADQVWKLQASAYRCDSFLNLSDSIRKEITDPILETSKVLISYLEQFEVQATRLAVIIVRTCESSNPANELIEHFCNERSKNSVFRNMEDFQIHGYKSYLFSRVNLNVNSWVRCLTGFSDSANGKQPIIIIEQDMNTVENTFSTTFAPNVVHSYFSEALKELSLVFEQYFPRIGGN